MSILARVRVGGDTAMFARGRELWQSLMVLGCRNDLLYLQSYFSGRSNHQTVTILFWTTSPSLRTKGHINLLPLWLWRSILFIFLWYKWNFGRALEDDGDDEVWKMIQQENFYLTSFVQSYQYNIESRTSSELSTTPLIDFNRLIDFWINFFPSRNGYF